MTLWSQGCSELVKLLHGCDEVVAKLSQGCHKLVTRLQGLYNLATTLSFLYGWCSMKKNCSCNTSSIAQRHRPQIWKHLRVLSWFYKHFFTYIITKGKRKYLYSPKIRVRTRSHIKFAELFRSSYQKEINQEVNVKLPCHSLIPY